MGILLWVVFLLRWAAASVLLLTYVVITLSNLGFYGRPDACVPGKASPIPPMMPFIVALFGLLALPMEKPIWIYPTVFAGDIVVAYVAFFTAPSGFAGLVEVLADALCAAYDAWREEHPEEDVYAFGIGTSPLGGHAGDIVMSEEGLLKVAGEYYEDHGGDMESLARDLRWSAYDSPYCFAHADKFHAVDERLQKIVAINDSLDEGDPRFDENVDALYRIFTGALNLFRQRALDGREDILLMVWTGDCSDQEYTRFLEHCNSRTMVEAHRESLAALR